MTAAFTLDTLRAQISALPRKGDSRAHGRFGLGVEAVDKALSGLERGAMHEVYAASAADAVAAHGFGLGLALRSAPESAQAPVVWVMQTRSRDEAGLLYGPGLHAWGLDPEGLILAVVRDTRQLMAAGEEALASGAAGAVILSGWGEARDVTLTAGRRLELAANRGGSAGFFVRAAARPAPSPAQTRWSVRAAPSSVLEAGTPGRPAFAVALTRSRSGAPPGDWVLEWDRDDRTFRESTASGDVVSVPAHRPTGAHAA